MPLFSRRSDKKEKNDYNSAKKVLNAEEFHQLTQFRKQKVKEKYQAELGGYKEALKEKLRSKRPSVRLSRTIESGLRGFAKQRKTQLRFARDVGRPVVGMGYPRHSTLRLVGRRGRGRPRGSFDPRYAAYGGVYEYRKRLNAQLRQQKLEFLRKQQFTPQQQMLLSQEEARQRAEQMNPENKIIPNTFGTVRLGYLHKEAEDAANIVP